MPRFKILYHRAPAGEDTGVVASQAKPHVPFIKELLALASGKDEDGNALLTAKDISEYSAKRRVDARATNPNFSLSLAHKLVGSSKCVFVVTLPLLNEPLSLFYSMTTAPQVSSPYSEDVFLTSSLSSSTNGSRMDGNRVSGREMGLRLPRLTPWFIKSREASMRRSIRRSSLLRRLRLVTRQLTVVALLWLGRR